MLTAFELPLGLSYSKAADGLSVLLTELLWV